MAPSLSNGLPQTELPYMSTMNILAFGTLKEKSLLTDARHRQIRLVVFLYEWHKIPTIFCAKHRTVRKFALFIDILVQVCYNIDSKGADPPH